MEQKKPYAHLHKAFKKDSLGLRVVERIDNLSLQEQAIQVASVFMSEYSVSDRPIIESALSLWAALKPSSGV